MHGHEIGVRKGVNIAPVHALQEAFFKGFMARVSSLQDGFKLPCVIYYLLPPKSMLACESFGITCGYERLDSLNLIMPFILNRDLLRDEHQCKQT